ncbi:MAG: hypothetical protein JKX79_02845 [Labilibaculum sp.]|nr:hypothetical protein [Labilibaculum sp.]
MEKSLILKLKKAMATLKMKYSYGMKKIIDFIYYRIVPEKIFLKYKFRKTFGYHLNLKTPITLNEKMQWLKLYDRTELHTICADKFLVRQFVEDRIGNQYLIPLLFNSSNLDELNAKKFPNYPFIIKSNNGCGTNFIVRDKSIVDWGLVKVLCAKWLKTNNYYQGKEWQYKNIKPQIIVEKLLESSEGKIPNDYKFHCFHGKVECIYVSIDREGKNKRNIYDKEWNPLLFTWARKNKDFKNIRGEEIQKPINLKKMIELAEILSSSFRFVRVDFYNLDGEIYFGELTFHHGSGFDHIRPNEWDTKLGKKLNLK